MKYQLTQNTDLEDLLPLRCSYMTGPDLQLAVMGVGFVSFGSQQSQFLNYLEPLASPQIENLICNFIPEIDFASLHLILNHPKVKTSLQSEVLLGLYQIPASPHVLRILGRSVVWPNPVLTWLLQKKIRPHELAFLNLLSAEETITLLTCATRSVLSKSDVLKFLEIASELILMKKDMAKFLEGAWSEKSLTELSDLRFPLSIKKNPVNQVQLRWPKSVATQAKRVQDKMGFQVQFFVSHPVELHHTLSQLEKMVPEWSSKVDGLNS